MSQSSKKSNITYFATTDYRSAGRLFGITQTDKSMHILIQGKSGTGKSTLLQTMIHDDIIQGRGIMFIDPHGDQVQSILHRIPDHRKADVIYFDVTDPSCQFGYNPIRYVSEEKRALVVSSILEALERLFQKAWGHKVAHILRFTLLALTELPSADFSNILDMLLDKSYRNYVKRQIKTETVLTFWNNEFPKYQPFDLNPIYNKLGGFLSYSSTRRVLLQNSNNISLRKTMDEGKILLVNLSKGKIGADAAHLLGALLVSSMTAAAFSRADMLEHERKLFTVFCDEHHNYSVGLINALAEIRKMNISLVLANQYMQQLDKDMQAAIVGNVGTLISFRTGYHDAAIWSKIMYPYFEITDFMNLPNYHIYLILMINGIPSKPFSAKTVKIF